MKNQFIFLFLLPFILACNPDKDREVDIEAIDVSTTDASELYFKNMRRSDYVVEERKDQGLDIYIQETGKSIDYPMIELSIVHNWRNDNAFIMIQPNVHFMPGSDLSIGEEIITIESANMLEQVKLAGMIYNALVNEEQFFLIKGEERTPFLDDSDDRIRVKSTLYDFFKLIEAF